jgi:hypothetical protein
VSVQSELEALADPFEVAVYALVSISRGAGGDDPDLMMEGLRSNLIANVALARIETLRAARGES